ncbi:hypothetical protein NS14008_16690 [Nocardia seriolae]|nr:hypothetical protein NS14008_16690 [Nocardia seriolae]
MLDGQSLYLPDMCAAEDRDRLHQAQIADDSAFEFGDQIVLWPAGFMEERVAGRWARADLGVR